MARLKHVATFRYRHELPSNASEILCLKSGLGKMAFLRDLCKSVGISIYGGKDYLLENDEEKLKQILQDREPVKKGKKQQARPEFDLEAVLHYSLLPFQAADIVQIFPIVKEVELINTDIKQLV
jgi:hypothetical protein